LVKASSPDISDALADRLIELSDGSPLFLRLLVDEAKVRPDLALASGASLTEYLDATLNRVLAASSDPSRLLLLIERLSPFDLPEPLSALADAAGLSTPEVRELLHEASNLLTWREDDKVSLFHSSFRQFILERQFFTEPLDLSSLTFGAEEAEKDRLLNETYVSRPGLAEILSQGKTLVIGDRGSGKSAIFRQLVDPHAPCPGIAVCPLSDPQPLLTRALGGHDGSSTVEESRAAWLLIVSAILADKLPDDAPKPLRRAADDLRVLLGLKTPEKSGRARLLGAFGRTVAGASITVGVGLANLKITAPEGARKPSAPINIENFLDDYDQYLSATGMRAVVPIDRIDEVHKYDRARQETLVQGLLQAEGRISQWTHLSLVVFLRTDLFEIYDIQEKNKLVSRTLRLRWTDDDWLRLLVRRVFTNPQLARFATVLQGERANSEIVPSEGLDVLFPNEIEGQPLESWLIESVKNGNGAVSPRSVILLLLLTRGALGAEASPGRTLPLFPGQALRNGMTELSDLTFNEVVNDFQVARTFVRNVRAAKKSSFELSDVENLFDPADGAVNQQVELLERLGFLERVVVQEDSGARARFRIPSLYTRSWVSHP
jgi:hypothetical protein